MGTFGKFSPKNCFSLARAHHQKLVYNCVEGTFRTVLGLVCWKIIPTGGSFGLWESRPLPSCPTLSWGDLRYLVFNVFFCSIFAVCYVIRLWSRSVEVYVELPCWTWSLFSLNTSKLDVAISLLLISVQRTFLHSQLNWYCVSDLFILNQLFNYVN